MKVYIGPYKNWIGPWQIAHSIPFLNEDQKDRLSDYLSKTWVNKFCDWINDLRGDRNINIRIDPYDVWSMDNTLAHIILPMLKQLKATKHGSACVDDEDLPTTMRYTSKKSEDDYETEDHWVHHKWDWVLNEMIWAFEQHLTNWEVQYIIKEGEIDWDEHPEDEGKDVIPFRWKKEYVVNWEGRKAHQERIQNGFRLFGKYYSNLWD